MTSFWVSWFYLCPFEATSLLEKAIFPREKRTILQSRACLKFKILKIYSLIKRSLGSRHSPRCERGIKKIFPYLDIILFIHSSIHSSISLFFIPNYSFLLNVLLSLWHCFRLWGYADRNTAFIDFTYKWEVLTIKRYKLTE